ncbi:MAG: metallophosphoesterase [Bacillota bacterium]
MYFFIILALIIIIKIWLLYHHTTKVKKEEISLKSDKISDEIAILQLSDFHYDGRGKLEKNLKKKIREVKYDLVVLTGDYLNDEDKLAEFITFLNELEFKTKVFAVSGNHDYFKNIEEIKDNFEKEGIIFLENESEKINVKGNEINIIGVGSPDGDHDDFKKAVDNLNLTNSYNLVLSHTYHILDSIKNYDIDLVLAGDTHGGQIIYPLLGKILLNIFFETKYLAGRYEINDTTLYVNRGLGTSLLPMRFNAYPEISQFTIKNSLK